MKKNQYLYSKFDATSQITPEIEMASRAWYDPITSLVRRKWLELILGTITVLAIAWWIL